MSLQKLPGSFGVMFPSFSLPIKAERSRNKKRLEASLAGLCELDLLKQRQENRVMSALCLGDCPAPGRPPWAAVRSGRCASDAPNGDVLDAFGDCGVSLQTSSLRCTPWGIMASLEQRVAELKVNSEVKLVDSSAELEKSQTGSDVLAAKQDGSHESHYHPIIPHSFSGPEGILETETVDTWHSDIVRGAPEIKDDLTQDVYQEVQKVETYIFGLVQRRVLLPRSSKPRTSLAHDTRGVSVARQSSLCYKEDQHSPKQVAVQGLPESLTLLQPSEETVPQACHNMDQDHYIGFGFTDGSPPSYHLQQSVQHQPGLYHKPRHSPLVNDPHSNPMEYPSCRMIQTQPDSSNSDPESPQHFHNYPSSPPLSKSHPLPSTDEQLVNAEYIPAQPCRASTRSYANHHSNPHKSSGPPKHNRSTYSPERSNHHLEQQAPASQVQPSRSKGAPKKCRSNEDKGGASRKPGKKACRSQSENSLQRVPERKYNTVERDGGGSGSGSRGSRSSQSRSKKQQQGSVSYRRWQSTLELSQDEADQPPMQAPMQPSSASNQRDHCVRRTRKPRLTHTSYALHHHQNHHHSHHHQHMEFQLERDHMPVCPPSEDYGQPGQGESDSSTSDADSPDSSSLTSDSDESGGLVWPQQLSPQLSLPSPPAPPGAPLQHKAFVKIKASHALKKKILRFRTGSLKVMTTV
ncbi:dapper homolog 3 isoform X2 [Thalassophryne amazonica]|uniref:dapper homolog 3 isoform X2 n=1 Tax=Thalassophryne amazonica TaxID=390379 RepID=UPI001470BE2A|nr:dapper homolog 3 isoform X2 [Thalassophryne amazonica]